MLNSKTKKEPRDEKGDSNPQESNSQNQSGSPNVAASVKRRLDIEFSTNSSKE